MKNITISSLISSLAFLMIISCGGTDMVLSTEEEVEYTDLDLPKTYFNYENQNIPSYITKDNTNENNISDEIATLGRVLFYDKTLSKSNTISCASCHQQSHAFSDPEIQSLGIDGGLTSRHSMRLVNTRFSDEINFFWDERVTSLEEQTTEPIKDHIEMGFSGKDGDPTFEDLIVKMQETSYYANLFKQAFGNEIITESKMQLALAQFVRSIQSFDSKFDEELNDIGLANLNQDFPNFTTQENLGKRLFLVSPAEGGAGCNGCHRAPEFDIEPNTLNNGVIGVAGSSVIDLTNTRSPSLRDLVNSDGTLNGPFMHDGSMSSLLEVVNHYNKIPDNPDNTNLDHRFNLPGIGLQSLNLSDDEKNALIAFLKTLTGNDIYTNEKWSDPFK